MAGNTDKTDKPDKHSFTKKLTSAQEAITFDDVLLQPGYSEVAIGEIDVSTFVTRNLKIDVPIVSSPMDTVTEGKLAAAMARRGGVGVVHYNIPIAKQVEHVAFVKSQKLPVGAAVGPNDDERVSALMGKDVDFLVIDTAHGFRKIVIDAVKRYKKMGADVVAGNIVSAGAAEQMISAGADGLRVGLGPGSICTTRIITGIGVPQLTAVSEVADVAKPHNVPVIADGGIKYSGDLAKALAAGASCGMLGNIFAGTDESPGDVIESEGQKFKKYRGMGSVESLKANYANRYDAFKKSHVPEGVSGLTKYRGSVDDVITQFEGGLKKAMVYVGAKNLEEFQRKARFVRITSSGFTESHPHSLMDMDDTLNYSKR
ncbi:IMP dehydrogenase [Candidatus Micrarchaeota archaeon]|nr:IMP dehydrogenase [Candidatus Micrarchaeota archaeon]